MEGLKGMYILLKEEDLVDPERKEIKSVMLKLGVEEISFKFKGLE